MGNLGCNPAGEPKVKTNGGTKNPQPFRAGGSSWQAMQLTLEGLNVGSDCQAKGCCCHQGIEDTLCLGGIDLPSLNLPVPLKVGPSVSACLDTSGETVSGFL